MAARGSPGPSRSWGIISIVVAMAFGCVFGVCECDATVYARFALRLNSRSRAATVLEQARAVQDLLLASNPQDGVSGKWVLRRTAASRPKSGGASVQAAAPAIAPPRVKSAATPAVPAAPAPAPAAESPTTDGSTTAPALVAPPGSDTVGLATKASADFAAPQAGFTRVPALAYTRQRILAFRNAVMGGGAAGSAMPMDTQDVPCDQEPSMADPVALAQIGVLMLPFHHFSARYSLDVPVDIAAWMAAAGAEDATATMAAAASLPGSAADVYRLWGPTWAGEGAPPLVMTVEVAAEAAAGGGGAKSVRAAVDMDAHARALARCVIEHAPASWYWRDNDRLRASLERERRYPRLQPVYGSGDAKAIARSLFRDAPLQPVPQVLTFFNVVISDVGYVFVPQTPGAAPRVASAAASGRTLPPHFRPIMCLYREFDHSRGGNDARYSEPTGGVVHDEVIVLSQFWGDAVFHIYQEDFIRLASMLDYAAAHPHVKLHVMTPHSGPPHKILLEVMDLFGIDHSRAVYGNVAARIVHIPEGQPCGEAYAVSQVLLREVVRERLGLRTSLDVWADGAALRHGLERETASAPPGMQVAAAAYSAALHGCVRDWYPEVARPGVPKAHPFSWVLQSATALRSATLQAGVLQAAAGPQPASPPPPKPVVVLIERSGSRAVGNGEQLRGALAGLPVDLRVFGAGDAGSQADHLRLFAAADVVVGPHGAGLTNALAAWPGTLVVEFIPEAGLSNLVYMQSSLLLGFGFQSFTPAGSSYYGGFHVEADRVRDVVREALE